MSLGGRLRARVRLKSDTGTASISLAEGLNLMLCGFGGPFAAALYDRYGLRRCVVVALAIVAVGSLATLRMTEMWQLALVRR